MGVDKEGLDSLLRLIELDRKLRAGDIALPEPKPLEVLLEGVKKEGKVKRTGAVDGRTAAGKARAKKNASRRKRTARQARWRRNWKERVLTEAMAGEGWYKYLRRKWVDKGRGWCITPEEWEEYVSPNIPVGVVIELRRYDTSKPTELVNIVVYNSADGSVLFDGAEHKLRLEGFIL